MITLTTPAVINSVLGGNVPINYDKLVLSPVNLNPKGPGLNSQLRLVSTASAEMPEITGTLTINASSGLLEVQVPQLDFYRSVTLTNPQLTSVQGIISDAQNALENGLISVGVIAGNQSAGV